jgi:hypothetical protein
MALPDTWPCPTTGSSSAIAGKNPYPQLKLHRKLHRLAEVAWLAEVASARHSEGSPLALPSRARFPMREPEEIST